MKENGMGKNKRIAVLCGIVNRKYGKMKQWQMKSSKHMKW